MKRSVKLLFLVAVFSLLTIPSSTADLIIHSASGKFLIRPVALPVAKDLIEVKHCLPSVPSALLAKKPEEYCLETIQNITPDILVETSETVLDPKKETKLRSEVEEAGFPLAERPFASIVLEQIFTDQSLMILDVRKLPVLGSTLTEIFRIPSVPAKKSGTLRAAFLHQENAQLSEDGWALFYSVQDTVFGLDLWSEKPILDIKMSPTSVSTGCCRTKAKPSQVDGYLISPNDRYFVILNRYWRNSVRTRKRLVIFDRVEDETVQTVNLKTRLPDSELLGFSRDGSALAVRFQNEKKEIDKMVFYSFEALLDGTLEEVPEPEISESLRRNTFEPDHPRLLGPDRARDLLSESPHHGLEDVEDGLTTADGATTLTWGNGRYHVFRLDSEK